MLNRIKTEHYIIVALVAALLFVWNCTGDCSPVKETKVITRTIEVKENRDKVSTDTFYKPELVYITKYKDVIKEVPSNYVPVVPLKVNVN